jgi:hypothetical protein
MAERCTNARFQVAVATKYWSVAPRICLILGIEFSACHPSEAKNSEEAPTFLEKSVHPCDTILPYTKCWVSGIQNKTQRSNSVLNTAHHT